MMSGLSVLVLVRVIVIAIVVGNGSFRFVSRRQCFDRPPAEDETSGGRKLSSSLFNTKDVLVSRCHRLRFAEQNIEHNLNSHPLHDLSPLSI